MSALSAMTKSVLVIGLVMILITQLYPGANAAWSSFSGTLETGINMPSFQNPNDVADIQNRTIFFDSPGNYAPVSTQDCSSTNWNECLNDDPRAGNVTFYSNFTVNIAGLGITGGTIKAVYFTWYCSLLDWNPAILWNRLYVNITKPDGTLMFSVSNSQSCFYHLLNPVVGSAAGAGNPTDALNGAILEVNTVSNADLGNFNASMSQMIIRVDYQGGALVCGSWDIACAFSSAANLVIQPIVNTLKLMWNTITYVLGVIWAIISFLANLLIGLFTGLFGTFAYFFALPGAPPIAQAIVSAIMVAELVMIFLVAGSYVVGMLGGVVNKL